MRIETILLNFVILVLLLLACAPVGSAQEKDEYQKWLKKEQEKLQQFKDQRDKEFTEFLKQEWKQMKAFQGLVPDEKPKPVRMPVYQSPPTPPKDTVSLPVRIKEPPPPQPKEESKVPPTAQPPKDTDASRTKETPITMPQREKESPPAPRKEPPVIKEEPKPEDKLVVTDRPTPRPAKPLKTFTFTFFEKNVAVASSSELSARLRRPVDKEAISEFWAALSRWSYEEALSDAQRLRTEMRLNDWGYAELLYKTGETMFGRSYNESVLYTWFTLVKSGFDARVGYHDDKVYLLIPTNNSLYFVSYFALGEDKRRFYAVQLNPQVEPLKGSLYTYDGKYPGAEKAVDFGVRTLPVLRSQTVPRRLMFFYNGQEYSLEVKLSKDAVDFFDRYPQTNYEVYFGAPPSPEATASLLTQLKSIVQGKSEREAVNMILRFVQTAFEYKTDQEQFGREKPFFPDETLYYPYSDCEDRAILFAYLVRSLLGLEVVGLDYPAHIATAVRFSTEITGDAIVFQGKRYIICDPTYINADVGACMPQFKGVNPNVIRIE